MSTKTKEPAVIFKAKVESIHDGDTPTLSVELTFPVRVLDLDCPELSVKDGSGIRAKEEACKLLPIGSEVILEIPTNNPLHLMDSVSLGRILGHVYLSDGSSFKDEMIKRGCGNERKK